MKIILFAVAGLLAVNVSFGDEARPSVVQGAKETSPRAQAMLKHFGGFIEDKRSQKGSFSIVNAQESAKVEWLAEAGEVFAKDLRIAVNVVSGTFDMTRPSIVGSASVFVVDDEKLPISLIAPEARWAVVNIASLRHNSEAFFKARVMKAVTRAMVLLLGGADSQYPMCIMGSVVKASDLDKYPDSRLPVDVLDRMQKNMSVIGMAPFKITTYRKACEDGWAPQPTNEYQQAIWDKVHTLPSEPMKIKPETTKQK